MGTTAEGRAAELGLEIPNYANPPYGERYGTVKAFHRIGNFVEFSGITPEARDGKQLYPGKLGREVSLGEAQEAARFTAVNILGMIRFALGSLDQVASLSRVLCFINCTEDFDQLDRVSQGASDLFMDVFGKEVGRSGRASVGASSLTRQNCFELWLSLEAAEGTGRQ